VFFNVYDYMKKTEIAKGVYTSSSQATPDTFRLGHSELYQKLSVMCNPLKMEPNNLTVTQCLSYFTQLALKMSAELAEAVCRELTSSMCFA